MLKLLRKALKSVGAFRKSQGGTRRISVSIRIDLKEALEFFKKISKMIPK